MKLYKQDIQDWINIEKSGIPSFMFSDVLPDGFVEFDSIENIDIAINNGIDHLVKKLQINGQIYYCDYKFGRDHLKTKYSGTWSDYNDTEKYIFCKHNIGAKADRIAYLGLNNIKKLMQIYSYKATYISRNNRAIFAYNEVYNRILDATAKEIAKDAQQPFMRYKELGLDGLISNDPASINDYIQSTTGTEYENSGLKNKTIISIEGFANKDDFCDYLTDITIHGKYLNYEIAEMLKLV